LRKWRAKFELRGNTITPSDELGNKVVTASQISKVPTLELALMTTGEASKTGAECAFTEETALNKKHWSDRCAVVERLMADTPDAWSAREH
jgi:hypothetical protein